MTTIVSRTIAKRCPFVDERDIGVLTITFEDEAPELHELGRQVDTLVARPISHEKFTAAVRRLVPSAVAVESHWHTGPWTVDVTESGALFREPVDTEDS